MGFRSSFFKFKNGEPLSRKNAMEAQCYACNGESAEMTDDCLGTSCPLYGWSPWGKSHEIKVVKKPGRYQKQETEAPTT